MVNAIISMYLTAMSIILAGVANMIFTKTKLYKRFRYPIDAYREINGKRLFGDNKTWIGFISMIVFNSIFQIICGLIYNQSGINNMIDVYNTNSNTVQYNLLIGTLFGFMYVIFELPNSFIKRKLDIASGKTVSGIKGKIFFVVDQLDSMIGAMIIIKIFSDISVYRYFSYVLLGGLTHIVVNLVLYKLKIRKNI